MCCFDSVKYGILYIVMWPAPFLLTRTGAWHNNFSILKLYSVNLNKDKRIMKWYGNNMSDLILLYIFSLNRPVKETAMAEPEKTPENNEEVRHLKNNAAFIWFNIIFPVTHLLLWIFPQWHCLLLSPPVWFVLSFVTDTKDLLSS